MFFFVIYMLFAGMLLFTNDIAPIVTLSPIVIEPIMQVLAPISTLLPIIMKSSSFKPCLFPTVVFCLSDKLQPIRAFS